MGMIKKYNDDGSITNYDDSGNIKLPGTSDSWLPDMSGVTGGSPDTSTKSTPFNTPPLSDAAKQFKAPPQNNPDVSGAVPDISIPSKTPLDIPDTSVPGTDSQLPGVKDPYMQNLYAKNTAASDNMNKILAGMPTTTGDGGWGALQNMFNVVLQLSKGVGQKNLAANELARAQQQLQQHEQNQAQAEYWRIRGDSDQTRAAAQDKKSDAYSKKVDNDNANKQSSLDLEQRKLDLQKQLNDGKITKQQYDNQYKQLQINMLNPSAATPPATPPSSTGTPPASPTPTPPPAASSDNTTIGTPPAQGTQAPAAGDHGGAVRTFTARGGTLVTLNKDNTITDANGRFYDSTGNPK